MNRLAFIKNQSEEKIEVKSTKTPVGEILSAAKDTEPETEQEKKEREEMVTNMFLAGLVVFIGLFFVFEALFEKYKPPLGHVTGVIVSLGILISWIIYKVKTSDDTIDKEEGNIVLQDFNFNQNIFFDIVLPLIVFPSGFNMRRKKFFKNIGTIMKLGFVATLLCCTVYSIMMWGAWKVGWMNRYHPECDVAPENYPADGHCKEAKEGFL